MQFAIVAKVVCRSGSKRALQSQILAGRWLADTLHTLLEGTL